MNVSDPLGPIDVEFWYYGTEESYAWVGVYAAPDSTYSTSLEMIKDEQVHAKSAGVDSKLEHAIECSKYTINDVQACSMIYSDLNPDLQEKVLFVYAVDEKGIEYALYLGATHNLFEYFKPVFDHMVNSFALKGIR
jgi:hypothetical protein